MAIDCSLGVDPADALQAANIEGIYSNQGPGVRGFDVALTELWIETFEEADLFVSELDGSFASMLLEAQKAIMFGKEVVSLPNATDAA